MEVLLPAEIERFPWAGHIGLSMLSRVIDQIERANSTLVFTNTRNQTELWYRAILRERPDWAGRLAVLGRTSRIRWKTRSCGLHF